VTPARYRYFVVATSVIPPVTVILALFLLLRHEITALSLIICLVFYVLTAFGIWAGYHRLLTHRAFKTSRRVRLAITVAGIMGGQGPPIPWVAQHRRHHTASDREGDPHSPHLEHPPGVRGTLQGLYHAHIGWLLDRELDSQPMRYAPDLVREKDMRVLSRYSEVIFAGGLVLPGVLGLVLTGSIGDALACALMGGPVRVFLVLHATYMINSVGHYFGYRRYATNDHSRNVFWLAMLTLGEGFHHNHHAFPRAASVRLRWWEFDGIGGILLILERLHVIWDVNRVEPAHECLKRHVPLSDGLVEAGSSERSL
jgi:stearoyl-CoA desaturase (delta-9 desaturase)